MMGELLKDLRQGSDTIRSVYQSLRCSAKNSKTVEAVKPREGHHSSPSKTLFSWTRVIKVKRYVYVIHHENLVVIRNVWGEREEREASRIMAMSWFEKQWRMVPLIKKQEHWKKSRFWGENDGVRVKYLCLSNGRIASERWTFRSETQEILVYLGRRQEIWKLSTYSWKLKPWEWRFESEGQEGQRHKRNTDSVGADCKQQKSTLATRSVRDCMGIPSAAICRSQPSQCNLLEQYEAVHKN